MKKSTMKRVIVLLFILAFAVSVQAATPEGPEERSRSNRAARAKLIKAFDEIDRNYVDAVDMSPLVEEALRAMAERLDPHSVYVPAGEAEREKILMEGGYGGVGAEAQWIRDTITVVGLGTGPAERAGVKFGDRIVSVDGRNVVGLPEDELPRFSVTLITILLPVLIMITKTVFDVAAPKDAAYMPFVAFSYFI